MTKSVVVDQAVTAKLKELRRVSLFRVIDSP